MRILSGIQPSGALHLGNYFGMMRPKCSFCYQTIERGLWLGLTPGVDVDATPACVVACPTSARMFGDLNDPESNVSKALKENPHYRLRESLGTVPRVYYLPAIAEKMEA